MNSAPAPHTTDTLLQSLRDAGAARVDAVGWHYIETLAARTGQQTGAAQALLQNRLHQALTELQARMTAAPLPSADKASQKAEPSPMAALLQDMKPPAPAASPATAWPGESPRVRQFRRQLRKISVQKQVSQAIAQAPQNAGPINSHMLVLRALGLMRDISPDYLNRFMTHVDTLLCLEDAERLRATAKKSSHSPRTSKNKSAT